MHTNVLPVLRAASPLIPVPKNSAQRTKLLLETLRWVQENARCVESRRYVSRVLRMCEGKK
jgi:hypothetical protein